MGGSHWPCVAVAGILVAAVGCAHAPTEGDVFGAEAWSKAVTRSGLDPGQAVYPFDTTPEMETWVRAALRGTLSQGSKVQLETLQQEMFDAEFGFTYGEDVTLTAAEAFDERRGNCLSFTVLFVAMARSAGIPTFLMTVRRTPEVDLDEGLVVVNRHVVAGYRSPNQVDVFDFYVTSAAPFIQERVVDDVSASAMYHNNLGGAAIRNGDLREAFWNLEIATRLAPDWAPAWVNLGVVRFRSGDIGGALEAYQRGLEAEPNNSSALTNMAFVYRQLGRTEEAEAALAAAAQRTSNPFTLIAMADAEMVRGNLTRSARYLRKAKRWYPGQPEVYEAKARLARQRSDDEAAAKYSKRADELRRRQAAADR